MLRAPQSAVRLPVEGMDGWGDIAEQLGRGIASALETSAKLTGIRERVQAGGELAAFSEKLHQIGSDAEQQLAEQDVNDWDYSWNAAAASRFQDAVDSLPWGARKAGAELASAYSARASLQARRKHELRGVEQARENWQKRVDDAIQAGDAARASAWLESAAGVFVPSGELEMQKTRAGSKACLVRWERDLQRSPLTALAAYASSDESLLPSEKEDRSSLELGINESRRTQRREWAHSLAGGYHPNEQEWRQMLAAGVVTPSEVASARSEAQPLSVGEQCEWMQRITECPADDDAVTTMLMGLGTGAMPDAERGRLLEYVGMASRVHEQDRLAMSSQLRDLYVGGGFGCPTDDFAQQRLLALQQTGIKLLAEEGTEATAHWLQQQRDATDAWITINDLT